MPFPIPAGAIRVPLPDIHQRTKSSCGAATLTAIARYFGITVSQRQMEHRTGMHQVYGSDTNHLIQGANYFGLTYLAHCPMTLAQVRYHLRRGRPVAMMLQAWDGIPDYRNYWDAGHWVTAIGFNKKGIYFEDPWITNARAYTTDADLDRRWHDYDRVGIAVHRSGIVIWKSGPVVAFPQVGVAEQMT